jgi:hypothetical protein
MARRARNTELTAQDLAASNAAAAHPEEYAVAMAELGQRLAAQGDAVADAERRLAEAVAAHNKAASDALGARLALRTIDPITDANALTAPTPRMLIAAEGMQGTITPVTATKYNKKSVRVTGDNGRTYTLYHEGGVITHRWDDADYKAEKLQLYPITAQDVIAEAGRTASVAAQAAQDVADAQDALAIARLERNANWTHENLPAVTIGHVGEGYALTMRTNAGGELAAIITQGTPDDRGRTTYDVAYTVAGRPIARAAYADCGLPSSTMLAAIAYDLATQEPSPLADL